MFREYSEIKPHGIHNLHIWKVITCFSIHFLNTSQCIWSGGCVAVWAQSPQKMTSALYLEVKVTELWTQPRLLVAFTNSPSACPAGWWQYPISFLQLSGKKCQSNIIINKKERHSHLHFWNNGYVYRSYLLNFGMKFIFLPSAGKASWGNVGFWNWYHKRIY